MSERVTTWGELLGRRGSERFVGRCHEIEQFRLNFLYTVPPALLFVLRGPGGIGKSALLAEYATIAQEHGFVTATVDSVDLQVPGEAAVLQMMSVLAQQLSAAGVPLTTFEEVRREYTAALQAMARDSEAPGHVWDLFGGAGDSDPWAVRAWDEYLLHTFSLRRSPLIRNPIGTLTERFVQDLNAWATVRRILLCFDGYERFTSEGTGATAAGTSEAIGYGPDAWLFDLVARGQLSTNIWLLMGSRDPLPRAWEALDSVKSEFTLRPFSRRDSSTFLRHLGVAGEAVIASQVEGSRADPLALTILASLPRTCRSEPGRSEPGRSEPERHPGPSQGDMAHLVEQYVASLEPVLRAAVLKCAAARWLDEGVISALVGDQAVARVLKWLEESPLVIERLGSRRLGGPRRNGEVATSWRFRSALRPQLDALARQAGGFSWEAAHQTLYAYYRQQLELRGPEPQYLDPTWQRIQLEAHYHSLVAGDEAEACDAALLSFLRGVRQFHPWAGAVVRVWREATEARRDEQAGRNRAGSRRESDSQFAHRAEVVSAGWDALMHRDWDTARAFTEQLLSDSIWEPETRQALRILSQLIAGRLALPPAAVGAASAAGKHHRDDLQVQLEMEPDEPASPTVMAEATLVCEPDADTPQEALAEAVATGEEALQSGSGPTAEAMAEEHCGYANRLLGDGAYDVAIEEYDRALALDPHNIAATYNRGLAYTRIGALSNALADFARVIELGSDDAHATHRMQAYHQRGLVYVRQGALDRAVADFDAVIGQAGTHLHASHILAVLYERANAYFRLQSFERAIEDYTQVLQYNPSYVEAYLNRGRSHAARGENLEALRDYNQAIGIEPNRAVAYSYRGQAYVWLERYPEALADYARALELNPRDATVHNNRGLLYVRIAAYPQAIEAYQHAMAVQPDWATPYYNAACAAALANDAERATLWLARAIALREGYRAMALKDTDFAPIREDPRFAALVGIKPDSD